MKKIILTLFFLQSIFRISYAQPGSLDNTFGSGGKVTTSFGSTSSSGNSVAIQNDGKIVVAGVSYTTANVDLAIVRYNTNGTLDNSFDSDGKLLTDVGGFNDFSSSVAIQNDGKIVVAGYSWNGTDFDFSLIRYNNDGTLDNTFSGDGIVITDFGNSDDDEGQSLAIQNDGKIIVAGSTIYNDTSDFAMVRYNSDGSLDNTFDLDGKVTTDFGHSFDDATSVAIQSNGKIIVTGHTYTYFSSGGTNAVFAIASYNSDGSLNNTFSSDGKTTTNFGTYAESMAIQDDDKIIVAGLTGNGTSANFAVVRFNSNGSLDNVFGTGGMTTTDFGSYDKAHSIAIQNDGKILLAGVSHNGTDSDFALTRYTSNGHLDNTFDLDGKVTTPIGTASEEALAIAIQSDGKIVISGYTETGSSGNFAVARYNNTVLSGIEKSDFIVNTEIYPNPTSGLCQLSNSVQFAKIEIINVMGEKIYSSEINPSKKEIDLSNEPKGIYFVEIICDGKKINKKIILE